MTGVPAAPAGWRLDSVVVSVGARVSSVLHPLATSTRAANMGARSRASRRDSLKVYVMSGLSSEGCASELRASSWGEPGRKDPAGGSRWQDTGPKGGHEKMDRG